MACPLGPKIMKMKTFLSFWKVKVKNCKSNVKRNNSTDLLGYLKFENLGTNGPPDHGRLQSEFFYPCKEFNRNWGKSCRVARNEAVRRRDYGGEAKDWHLLVSPEKLYFVLVDFSQSMALIC